MPSSRSSLILPWSIAVVAGLVIAFGPPQILNSIRQLVDDGASAGLAVVHSLTTRRDTSHAHAFDSQSKNTIDVLQRANAALAHQVATLNAQLQRQAQLNAFPVVDARSDPLVLQSLVPATVLGGTGTSSATPERLINLGRSEGLSGEELVVGGSGTLLDQGSDAGLKTDQLVAEGRALVGRILRVGRWTSRFQPVAHADFRIGAQLVRTSASGPVFGASGILSGDGENCRLEQVPAVEAVSVGDAVYCDAATTKHALIIGRVTSATLEPAAPFWTISVAPAADPNPHQVLILKSTFNPTRLANREQPALSQ